MDIETRSLKATGEPILMSARRQATTDVKRTEYRGTAEPDVTLIQQVSLILCIRGLGSQVEIHTLLHTRQPGIPRSLAKDQN